ncbi:Triosephosphate isomerase [Halotydeus destructor]|nr:Triosephosphate isomerase [Halotydeus destructor]
MGRKFFVGGNFKMNGTKQSIADIIKNLKGTTEDNLDPATEVVLGVPAIYLDYTKGIVEAHGLKNVAVSSQNVYSKASGAFTGEISVAMLKDIGLQWAIIGHSERRTIFGENDDVVATKVGFALDEGLSVIACIGETLAERQAGETNNVVSRQMAAIKAKVKNWTPVVIAYEPVWAIGTGVTASPEQAQEVHEYLRNWLRDNVSAEVSAATRILYGGSVTGGNCVELGKKGDIDGFLVGGASLKPEFVQIVNARR